MRLKMSSQKSKIEILDKIFSKFIRLRGADHRGFNSCFTCGSIMHWKKLQCGHFISRRHMSLRFDQKNCFPQCNECNCNKNGNMEIYRSKIIQRFGIVHLNYLEEKKNKLQQ